MRDQTPVLHVLSKFSTTELNFQFSQLQLCLILFPHVSLQIFNNNVKSMQNILAQFIADFFYQVTSLFISLNSDGLPSQLSF